MDEGNNAAFPYFSEQQYKDVPLHALGPSAVEFLALYLDQEKELFNGILRDYRGVAEEAGFTPLEIDSFSRQRSATVELISKWRDRADLNPTIGRLVQILCTLEREDVLTDCHQHFEKEAQKHITRQERFMTENPTQDQTVSPGPGVVEIPNLITVPDIEAGHAMQFDAFVCFNPSEDGKDLEFIRELIRRLEGPDYNLKLFVPYRDDLAGLNQHAINAKIISDRCRHMIVVLSPSFLKSEACEFQSTFAHSLSPGARQKRIVPIKIEQCETPDIMRIIAVCDFTKKSLWDWSWDRLAKSVKINLAPEDYQLTDCPQSSLSMNELISRKGCEFKRQVSESLPHRPERIEPAPTSFTTPLDSTGKNLTPLSPVQPEYESGFESLTRPQPVPRPLDASELLKASSHKGPSSPQTSSFSANQKRLFDRIPNIFAGKKGKKSKKLEETSSC